METKQRQFSVLYILIALGALVLFQTFLSRPHQATLMYSEFKSLLRAGKIADATINARQVSGTFRAEGIEGVITKERVDQLKLSAAPLHPFVSTRVEDTELVKDLESAKVKYSGRLEDPLRSALIGWVLPLLFFLWFFGFASKRMAGAMGGHGGLMAIGKSKAKVYVEQATGVTFADVAGIDEAKSELVEIVDFLKTPERYRRLGGKIPKGVLLLGAPGTGKTLLAKAVAGEAKVPFFSLSGSDFVEMFVGVGAARVRDLFVQAQSRAPSIIFIDELDALGRARSAASIMGGHEEREQTLNQLLAEMDGFDTQKGLIIMAATNRPEILDPALLRPGRFDRKVVIDRPDLIGREQILRVHARGVTLGPEVDLRTIAARTVGFVGADLANLINEAALRAARAGKDAVGMDDFGEAIDRLVAGLERKSRVMNPKEKEIVAHHEAGHALVAELRQHADRVAKVSIIPRGIAALGYTQQQPTEDRYLLTEEELLDRLDVLLGGRAAEEIICGQVSTGAQDDLQRATDLARDMVTRYGMSDSIGLATFESPRRAPYLDVPAAPAREYSEQSAGAIDAEVHSVLSAAYERAKATLVQHREALAAVAQLLISKEVIEREALLSIIGTHSPAEAPDRRVVAPTV